MLVVTKFKPTLPAVGCCGCGGNDGAILPLAAVLTARLAPLLLTATKLLSTGLFPLSAAPEAVLLLTGALLLVDNNAAVVAPSECMLLVADDVLATGW